MNPLIQLKTITSPLLITLTLLCFGLFPKAQAVVPPPDGGYPGGNTAEGQAALLNLTTGTFNTAVGFLSLRGNTEGNFNTAIGAGALLANTGDNNTATGAGTLLSNTTGVRNTANGAFALLSNTEGSSNTASGFQALFSNTTGNFNTATGNRALFDNTSGFENTANGESALENNTIGSNNTANGQSALAGNTTGSQNTGNGFRALANNTTGSLNTANGSSALENNTTGSGNIALGAQAGSAVTTANNVICIGHDGANVNNSCFISQIFGKPVGNDALAVLVDSFGKLGTMSSSQRFKKEIRPMDKASEAILGLKPVTFHYKSDTKDMPQFGLIAEEVAEINPDLVVRDGNGEIYTVRYDAVNTMLLNEFLKEHRKVEEQGATIAQLKQDFQSRLSAQEKQIEALTAVLQRVSAQLEASRPAPQVAENNQ
jgi:Chaperone of endosialidase